MATQIQYSQHPTNSPQSQPMGQSMRQPMGQSMRQPMGQSMRQPMGDKIDQLPIDQTVPSHNEIRIVDSLFQQKKGIVDKILNNIKEILIIGVLFIVFSLPAVDEMVQKIVPPTSTSPYILLVVKTVCVMVLYFIINNFYLSRK